ncbi:MAG: hypothetical protein AB8B82_13880 [Roseovarius sp.]
MRRLYLMFCAIWMACAPVQGQAQAQPPAPNKADIVELLLRMDEFVPIEREFIALGFEGENLELAMAQHRRVFGDRDIAEYIADRVLSAYEGTLPTASEAGGLLGPLIDRGIGHLNTKDLTFFYKVENAVFKALPYRECGLAVKQRLSDQRLSNATARAAARMNASALSRYYDIQYKAARLGLRNKQVVLTGARKDRIERKIGEAMFDGSGDGAQMKMVRVFENPGRVSNRQACEAGRLIMDTVMTMQGRDLREALLYFSGP